MHLSGRMIAGLIRREVIFSMAKEGRSEFVLACTECKMQNYINSKNKKTHSAKVEWKKYCPRCNKSTLHREEKVGR